MQEPTKPTAIPLNPESSARLEELWKSSESGHLGFSPTIEPGFELDYYAGSTLPLLRLKIGILRCYLAPTIKPDELSRQIIAELEWIEKDLDIVWEALRFAMRLASSK